MYFRLLIIAGIYFYVYHYLGIQSTAQVENIVFSKLEELELILASFAEDIKNNI